MRFIAAVALLLAAPTTIAGKPLLAFDEVVVTATKRETNIRDVAADVTLLRGTDLRATMTASLADTFRFIPGVTHESSGSRFGTEGITIRGIGGNRIALELDGVPLSDQFDIGNFSNATRDFADAGLIEQVEILRGPASALYGSSAVGGVVALSTLDPRSLSTGDTSGGSASAFYRGRDDSRNLRASLALQSDAASLLMSGSYRDGAERQSAALDSPEDTQSYHREAALIKLVGENRYGHDWQLSAIRQTHDVQTRVTSVLGVDRFRSTTKLEGDDSHRMDILSAEYRFDMARSIDGLLRIFAARAEIRQNTLDERAAARSPALIDRDFYYTQRLRGAELNLWRDLELAGWSHRFGGGLEFSQAETTELRDGLLTSLGDGSVTNEILGESFPLRDFPVTVTRATGAYLSDQLTRGPLSLIVALRFDDNRLSPRADEIYTTDNPGTPLAALSNSDVSPKLGAIYHVGDDIDFYAQYARGFRAPPFEDANIGLDIPLFNIRAIPNPALRSETSDGWELGMRWQGDRTRLQMGAFRTTYTDFIETKVRVGTDPVSGRLLFQSINIGNASIRGLEARWAHELAGALHGLTLSASAYWAEGENRDNEQPLNSVGPAEAVVGVTWRSDDEQTEIRTFLTATKDWSRRDVTAGDLFEPAGHAVLDVFLVRALSERLTFRAGIGNATNRIYWRWSEVRGLAPDDALLPTLAEAGRNFSIGLDWDW